MAAHRIIVQLVNLDTQEKLSSLCSDPFKLDEFNIELAFPKGGWIEDDYVLGELSGSLADPVMMAYKPLAVCVLIVSEGVTKYKFQKEIDIYKGSRREGGLNWRYMTPPFVMYGRMTLQFYGEKSISALSSDHTSFTTLRKYRNPTGVNARRSIPNLVRISPAISVEGIDIVSEALSCTIE